MTQESHKVQVAIRVRPSQQQDDKLWVDVVNDNTLQIVNHRNTSESLQYEFGAVYGPTVSQATIYNEQVKPLLTHILKGQNGSVLAYGPTGAGKTHSILGTATDPGVIPRCVKELFASVKRDRETTAAAGEQWDFKTSYSYLEIYNEKVHDLLNPKGLDLPIREDQKKNISVSGLSQKDISCIEDFNTTFAPASKNRTTAATHLNERSSRSHSLLILRVLKTQMAPPYRKLSGKLHIIDLAGSEDNRRTGNQGIRMKESGAINSSLLVLGQVVEALCKGQSCVPYRNSKLTRLLQDSLGGNSISRMLVNLSPEERFYYDTYTTLNFACKAKKVINTVKTNETIEQQRTLKRHSSEKTLKTSPVPEKKKRLSEDKPSLQPFLSPFLRKQESFQQSLRHEVCSRLELLEGRLLSQMAAATGDASTAEPDSTTQDEHHNSVTDSPKEPFKQMENLMEQMKELQAVMTTKQPHTPPAMPTVSPLPDPTPSPPSLPCPEPLLKKMHKAKMGKVYKDGSCSSVPGATDISSSPLFLRPKCLKRRGFKSTATNRHPESPPSPEKPSANSSDSPSTANTAANFNPEAQQAHNERILEVLNTGAPRNLQELQTIGAKRANLIHSWRQLQGTFSSFDDLRVIPGITSKYVDNFLRSNLVTTG